VFLSGCGLFDSDDPIIDDPNNPYIPTDPNDPNDPNDPKDPNDPWNMGDCSGYGNYVIIEGQCIPLPDIVSGNINIGEGETIVNYMNSVELMNDLVADLSGSTGLAVVNKSVFEKTMQDSVALSGEDSDEAENIIVKLNEEGFFEEVSFSDDHGLSVEIKSNPLVLEVFGDFTVVAFEVDLGYNDPNLDFTQKLYDSLYSGGIYLIHNETGKLFATKQVEYTENTYTHWEDHSRTVTVMVTLGQPVVEFIEELLVDETGAPILDEDGKEQFTIVENPLFDKNGNPIIFNEGPVQMETIEIPVMEMVEVPVLDEDGNPILDENGNPKVEMVEQQILDENGNPKVDVVTQPVLDEDGNPVFEPEFELDIFIEDQREITMIDYHAHIMDNPLSSLAQRFVDKIVSEYYHWDYYRVNNYRLDNHSFAYNNDAIFYMDWVHVEGQSDGKQSIRKLYFDFEYSEIVIEDFLDVTKAGFDQCELIIDPLNNNVICDPWDGNIKIYSETLGLMTVSDSESLQPVTFPNGELYFYDYNEEFVDELDYWTTALYTIQADGTLQANYIELGEQTEMCYGDCFYGVEVDMYTADGIAYSEMNWVDMVMGNGSPIFYQADLQMQSVGEFDATRPECTDPNGCWYDIVYELLDVDGNEVLKVFASDNYFPTETAPNFIERYTMDENTVIEYQQMWSEIDMYCDNEIGCTNHLNIIDENINTNGLWMHDTMIVENGEQLIQEIRIKDDATITYEYEQTYNGETCDYESCNVWVDVLVFDMDGTELYRTNMEKTYALNDIIPLHIDYHITENTDTVYKTEVCTSSSGCWEWYNVDGFGFGITYDKDDMMYHSITFAETDMVEVTEETIVREVCTEPNGCWYNESKYIVLDEDGSELFVFDNGGHVEYGYKLPFSATLSITDADVWYQKEHIDEDAVCNETFCNTGVNIELDLGENTLINLGWGNITVAQGEKLMHRIVLSETSFESAVSEKVCLDELGCIVHSKNFIIVDEDGTELQKSYDEYWWQSLPVQFAYGEKIPVNEDFTVTFEVQNKEYRKHRISIHEFIHRLHETVVLDENLYLIERETWVQGDDNFILTFNEDTNRYSVKFTNISTVLEITDFKDGYIAINEDETAIIQFQYNEAESNDDYYYFDVTNLTEGLLINGVNDLIVDYDGSIYFKGVDNFIQDITGSISEDGTVQIDTEFTEREVIRVRPIN
jgi:hypothetical protein